MSTTFLKKIEKIFKNAAKPYFMRVSGKKITLNMLLVGKITRK